MKLRNLVGKHLLSAVDRSIISKNVEFNNCDTFAFELDGIAYLALEDPDDGYRSMLGSLEITDLELKTKFFPVEVDCKLGDEEGNFLNILNSETKNVIISIGTDYSDDYYPSFVAQWNPENI
jgi:hypothetical protein